MFITTHAALGALIGEQFPHAPLVAFGLSFVSHFLADFIPHGDTKLYKNFLAKDKHYRSVAYVVVDALVAIAFLNYILDSTLLVSKTAMIAGIWGGVAPDAIVGLYEVFRVPGLKWFHELHFWFHNRVSKHYEIPFVVGFTAQLLFLLFLLLQIG